MEWIVSVGEEFLIEYCGDTFVRYEGLLRAAHTLGLSQLRVERIVDLEDCAVMQATAAIRQGNVEKIFTEFGEATIGNDDVAALMPLASLRAKANALKDATGLHYPIFEMLPGVLQAGILKGLKTEERIKMMPLAEEEVVERIIDAVEKQLPQEPQKSGEELRQEFREQRREEYPKTREEQFAEVVGLFGLKWSTHSAAVKQKWALKLVDGVTGGELTEKPTDTQFLAMYTLLNNYLVATEGEARWRTAEGIGEIWKDIYAERVPFPNSLYKLSGNDWKVLTNQLKYIQAQRARRAEFFALCYEAGLWSEAGKSAEEKAEIAKSMREWMSNVLGTYVTTRKRLTPEEWGFLTSRLKEEYNVRLSDRGQEE